jgi:aspartyl-tRNA synthetase
MQRNLIMRHTIALAIRQYLAGEGFLEIETPILTASTPEGARDYLVPSRVHPGKFFALPQSPQIFKQILMISGLDRYFQIARCFRDEDQRADRQLEFTQVDLEMSFPNQETIFRVVEGFLSAAFAVSGIQLKRPFPRMTFDEAIRLYGIDKPDLRLPPMTEVSKAFAPENLQTLGIAAGQPLVAVRIPSVGELSRKERDELRLIYPPKLGRQNIKVFDDFKRLEKSFPGAIAKVREMTSAEASDYIVLVGGDGNAAVQFGDGPDGQVPFSGDMVDPGYEQGPGLAGNAQVITGRERQIYEMAGLVRLALAQKFADRHKAFEPKGNVDDYKFLWVTDFPFFEWDEESRTWTFAHHPFTSPHEEDIQAGRMESDPGSVRALAYDVVLNGTELGSGSIRIHRQGLQRHIFRSLGMKDEGSKGALRVLPGSARIRRSAAWGIALGLDRIAMDPAGASSLREVIAFPQDGQGDGPDGRRTGAGQREAAEGAAHPDGAEELGSGPGFSHTKKAPDSREPFHSC